MKPVLEVDNLTQVFKRKGQEDLVAVNHVNFQLMPGECLGIIGESGSGKSTTVRMITRLLDITEGTVVLDGKDITHISKREMRGQYHKIQMVFQSPGESFDQRRTLGDGIGEILRNNGYSKKDARAKVELLLQEVGLPVEFADRYPFQVSGGQCQRAAIARALAMNPKILICDEATSSLDVTIQQEILELLDDLRHRKDSNLAILFICHDIALVQQFCDRVLVMYKGDIVESGVPDEVIKNPQDDYTKMLIDGVL